MLCNKKCIGSLANRNHIIKGFYPSSRLFYQKNMKNIDKHFKKASYSININVATEYAERILNVIYDF